MINLQDLFKNSFALYLKNFPAIIKTVIWPLLFSLVVIFLPMPTFEKMPTINETLLFSAVMAFSFLLRGWVDQILTAVFYNSHNGQAINFSESAKNAFRRLPSYAVVLISWTIITTVGFIFFVIPGLIFMTWYLFITPIFVIEGLTGWQVLRRSHTIVSGYGLQIFWRFIISLVIFLLMITIFNQLTSFVLKSVISREIFGTTTGIVGLIFSYFVTPFLSAIIVVLYNDVKKLK